MKKANDWNKNNKKYKLPFCKNQMHLNNNYQRDFRN